MFGFLQEANFSEFFIKEGEPHYGQGSEDYIVSLVDDGLIECLSTESRAEPEPVLGHHEENVLVKHIHRQDAVPSVSFASMEEYERYQESELRDGIVGGSCRLHTL